MFTVSCTSHASYLEGCLASLALGPYRLGQPQVAWLNDEEDGRVNWVHLSTRLLVASIFVLVGEAGPRVVNPLIGGLLHYNELASSRRHSGFIGLHSIGGGLAWQIPWHG